MYKNSVSTQQEKKNKQFIGDENFIHSISFKIVLVMYTIEAQLHFHGMEMVCKIYIVFLVLSQYGWINVFAHCMQKKNE